MKYTDPKGHVTRFQYNDKGDLLSSESPLHNSYSRIVDPLGRVVAVTDPLGRRTELKRDAAGNVIQLVDPAGAKWTMTYNKAGTLLTRTDPTGRTTESTYDDRGMALSTQGPCGTEHYERDAHGNPIAVTNVEGAVWKYVGLKGVCYKDHHACGRRIRHRL
ncbi:MAG: RHS repeat protein [Polyangiaceae bacterium]|nr:RHS repeat protein [Polyangiaceae bacterium]